MSTFNVIEASQGRDPWAGDPWVDKDWENVEIPRDGMDRPLVMLPDGSKRVPYRRTTTFVGALEDRYNLELWKLRRTSWGLGQRPDLVLKAASLHVDDKLGLDAVAKDAMDYAEASAKATIGTALHKFTERLDRGQPLGNIPEPYAADLRAYELCMKRFKIEHLAIETFRVHDAWRIAGTADRISKLDGEVMIADTKTGDIDRIHKIVMQLAMYRQSVPYDIATDERYDDPWKISAKRGLVIHLPAGTGECTLHYVDIEKGRRGLQICYKVFDFRGTKRKELTWPVPHADDLPMETRVFEAKFEAQRAKTLDELRNVYLEATSAGIDDPGFISLVRERKTVLLSWQNGDEIDE